MALGVSEPAAIGLSPGRRQTMWAVDWRRLGRRAFIGGAFAVAAVQLSKSAVSHEYGLDFFGGTWHAGKAVLAGLNPYPMPESGWRLLNASSGFMTPPPLALLGIPFGLLPFWPAIAGFNLLCVVAVLLALRLLGATDKRVWVLALCSFPFISSLALGQPDGLFALAGAAAWYWRDDQWRGGVAAGLLIAAKLLAWPLVIWLLVTRRGRQAGVAAATAAVGVVGSWALIGFKGMGSYLQLLVDDAKTYEYRSHSLVSGFMHAGLSSHGALVAAVLTAAAVFAATVLISRGSDAGWFTAAVVAGILSSAIVWDHYLVMLLVCLAAIRRIDDPLSWLLVAALWLCPVENPANLWQAWLVPVVACLIALRIGYLSCSTRGAAQVSASPALMQPADHPSF